MFGRVPKLFGIISISFAVLFWLMMVRSLLLLLVRQKKAPQFIGTILFSEWDAIVAGVYRWFRLKAARLGIRLLYGGIAVLLLTQAIVWSGFFRQANYELAQYFIPWVTRPQDKEPAAVALEVSLSDNPLQRNPNAIPTIVDQLRQAGAKAVAVDYRLVEWGARRSLVQSGFPVLSIPYGMGYFIGDSIAEGHYTLDYLVKGGGTVHALIPRIRGNDSDIIIELLKRVRGYGEEVRMKKVGSNLVFGDYQLPVDRDGALYLDLNSQRYPREVFSTPVYVWQNRRTGELWYRNYRTGAIDTTGRPLAEKYAHRFRDKVVFLMRSLDFFSVDRMSPLAYGEMYAKAFECVLEKDYLVRSAWLHLPLAAFFLFLSGLIARFLRPLYAFPLLIAVAASAFLCGHWLFYVHRIFVDLSALVAATSLAAIVFPAVGFAHRNRQDAEPDHRVPNSATQSTN